MHLKIKYIFIFKSTDHYYNQIIFVHTDHYYQKQRIAVHVLKVYDDFSSCEVQQTLLMLKLWYIEQLTTVPSTSTQQSFAELCQRSAKKLKVYSILN